MLFSVPVLVSGVCGLENIKFHIVNTAVVAKQTFAHVSTTFSNLSIVFVNLSINSCVEFIFLSRLLGDNLIALFSIGIFNVNTVSVTPLVKPESNVTSTDLLISTLSNTIPPMQKLELTLSVKSVVVGKSTSSDKYLLSKFLKVKIFVTISHFLFPETNTRSG